MDGVCGENCARSNTAGSAAMVGSRGALGVLETYVQVNLGKCVWAAHSCCVNIDPDSRARALSAKAVLKVSLRNAHYCKV